MKTRSTSGGICRREGRRPGRVRHQCTLAPSVSKAADHTANGYDHTSTSTWAISIKDGRFLSKYLYFKNGADFTPYVVAELWSGTDDIDEWLEKVNGLTDNQIAAFDFPALQVEGSAIRRITT
jgi:hypothetical protein